MAEGPRSVCGVDTISILSGHDQFEIEHPKVFAEAIKMRSACIKGKREEPDYITSLLNRYYELTLGWISASKSGSAR